MQMTHADFNRSTALRTSLKRGLARQALTEADRDGADLPGLFGLAAGLRPNPKGLERMARRLATQPGVVRVALTPCRRKLSFTARALHRVEARVAGETAFRETGLIYLRAQAEMQRDSLGFRVRAVGFCGHALERLVERSEVPLDRALLPVVDAEARAIFLSWDRGTWIAEGGDEFHRAAATGLWAGGHDGMAADPDWGLATQGLPPVPIFSARTFLSPAQMRPTVYLRWKDDPACRIL